MIGCLQLNDASVTSQLSPCLGRCRKFWEISCTEFTGEGNAFELIQTVKMETRHPIE